MTKDTDEEWLLSVLPSAIASSDGRHLELHKRIVHLATLREDALSKLQQLDAVKVSLTEKKVIQQSRLVAALDARLSAAHAAVDPHRAAVHDHIEALESAAAYYSNILQGVVARPYEADWQKATEHYQHLQQQQEECLQPVVPSQLLETVGASLQPCPASHVEVVEQLRADNDQLVMQLQEARSGTQQANQQVNIERAARLLAEQQSKSMQEELLSLRRVADNAARHLGMPQQQHLLESEHKQQPLELPKPPEPGPRSQLCSSAAEQFLTECRQLRQQLQQLSNPAATETPLTAAAPAAGAHMASCQLGPQPQQQYDAQWTLPEHSCLQPLDAAAVLAGDPLQELRQSLLGCSRGEAAEARLQGGRGDTAALWCSSDARESRLRQAYQQMLRQVQARYQQEIRQLEAQHQQALQSQSRQHTESLSQLTQQHQDVCTRLAAAAADAADLQQRADLLQRDNQQLKQQVQQLQSDLAESRSSSLALAQVQHEQQLMVIRKEHEQLVQQATQEIEELKQQIKQQAAALPTAASITALVQEAASSQAQQQEAAYQSALQEREQQHISLLQELEQLRQLNAEPSKDSVQDTTQAQQPQGCNHLADSTSNPGAPQTQQGSSSHDYTLKAWRDFAEAASEAPAATKDVSSTESRQHEEPSPMSSLISAVLGTGRKAKQLQAAHAKRVHWQPEVPPQQQQSEVQDTAQLLHAMDYQGQLAELDQVLGLSGKHPDAAHGSPVCNSKPSNKGQQFARMPGTAAAVGAPAAQASERVAVAAEIKRQQGGLWPPQPAENSRSRSTSPAVRRQQQQHAVRGSGNQLNGSSSVCLRCGSNDAVSPGKCCFHPGLVPAPGPLMYSPEWHACRATCTPDMPGCYSRREHYYLPQFSAAAGRHSSKAGSRLVQPKAGSITCAVSTGSPSAATRAVDGSHSRQSLTNRHSSPMQRRASDMSVPRVKGNSVGCQSERQGELMPRSTVPVPVTPRMRSMH